MGRGIHKGVNNIGQALRGALAKGCRKEDRARTTRQDQAVPVLMHGHNELAATSKVAILAQSNQTLSAGSAPEYESAPAIEETAGAAGIGLERSQAIGRYVRVNIDDGERRVIVVIERINDSNLVGHRITRGKWAKAEIANSSYRVLMKDPHTVSRRSRAEMFHHSIETAWQNLEEFGRGSDRGTQSINYLHGKYKSSSRIARARRRVVITRRALVRVLFAVLSKTDRQVRQKCLARSLVGLVQLVLVKVPHARDQVGAPVVEVRKPLQNRPLFEELSVYLATVLRNFVELSQCIGDDSPSPSDSRIKGKGVVLAKNGLERLSTYLWEIILENQVLKASLALYATNTVWGTAQLDHELPQTVEEPFYKHGRRVIDETLAELQL
ncbi:hypothetical protein B0H17DRAFT_1134156 [Mycena rosella]|uniref:Uncharacterized protein n=1 Tax=Mycena rosella TaxID=1033263 RepID=A0AAD7DG50_MYCRO|nr:hypothetical protein B0H17DRAFT_1134156 [Mycena rosella]